MYPRIWLQFACVSCCYPLYRCALPFIFPCSTSLHHNILLPFAFIVWSMKDDIIMFVSHVHDLLFRITQYILLWSSLFHEHKICVCFFHLSSSIFIPTLTLTIPYGKSIRCKKQWPWHHHWHNVLFPCTYELFFHPSTRTRVLILHRDYSTEYSYPVHYIALDACKKVSGVLVTILTVVSIPINTLHPELTFATRNLCCCVLAFFLSLLQVCQDININNVHAGDTYWGRQVLTITPT